jgi:hypothetical protein
MSQTKQSMNINQTSKVGAKSHQRLIDVLPILESSLPMIDGNLSNLQAHTGKDAIRLQRLLGNQQLKPRPFVIQRDTDNLDRKNAKNALVKWLTSSILFLSRNRTWTELNLTKLVEFTGGSPTNFTNSYVNNVAGNVYGNATNEIIQGSLKKAIQNGAKEGAEGLIAATCATAGLMSGTPIGFAIGFIVGVAIETIVSALMDSSGTERHVGRKQAIIQAQEVIKKAGEQEEGAAYLLSSTHQKYNNAIDNARSQSEINQITKRLMSINDVKEWKLPNTGDRSLFRALLHDWILENAGDEENPGSTVDEDGWNPAVQYATKNKILYGSTSKLKPFDDVPDLDYHPELFAYQTRGEWRKAGLSELPANNMIKRTKEIRVKDKAADPAQAVMGIYDGQSFAFPRIDNPNRLIQFLKSQVRMFPVHRVVVNADIYRQKILVNCKLELSTSNNSVYVDKWKYQLVVTNPNTRLALGWDQHEFETSP